MRSSSPLISPGARSAEITICLFWSTSALKVWKNSSCVLSLPAMNCTSSTISTSTDRNSSLKSIICRSRSACTKRYMNCSADRYSTRRSGLVGLQFPGDGVHQVRLAQTDAAIQEQRVEGHRPAFGHPARGGMGQLVRLAHHEAVEGEARSSGARAAFTTRIATGATSCARRRCSCAARPWSRRAPVPAARAVFLCSTPLVSHGPVQARPRAGRGIARSDRLFDLAQEGADARAAGLVDGIAGFGLAGAFLGLGVLAMGSSSLGLCVFVCVDKPKAPFKERENILA
jgi:hypothetical protein